MQAGQQFAHFKIVSKLGEGGMGAVYLAEDQKLSRRVALKILPQEFSDNAERRERFQREARVAAQISHPNVTSIFDIGEAINPENGQPMSYIVMEHVEGQPLNVLLENSVLDTRRMLGIAEKIASGLAAAHGLKIVHRDIKPENVLVGDDLEPKILDFGLAKSLESPLLMQNDEDAMRTVAAGLTQSGKIVGTVSYMSPEQARGEALDPRSDLFSYGILLYRLATGNAPFSGTTSVSILAKIIEGEPEPLRQHNENVHPELERIIDTCLQKDPEDRYQDTRDLVRDLRQLRRQYDSGASQSSMSMSMDALPAARRSARKWVGLAVVAASVTILLLGSISLFRDGHQGSVVQAGENSLAILRFENKTGDEELAWLSTGLPEILLTDLTQCVGLSLISLDRVQDELKRSEGDAIEKTSHGDWVQAGRRLGATSVLSGSYFKLGDRIRIDARLEDVETGKIQFAEKVVGKDAFALVDSLTGIVANELHLGQDPAATSVTDMMTTSSEAYKFYHLGNEKFLLGLDEEARKYFNKALALDSTFALPYLRIGMSHIFDRRNQQGVDYVAKALQYQNKLPAREKNLLEIYNDVFVNNEFGNIYPKMEDFLSAYPDDKEARSIYGALVSQLSADTTLGFAQFEKVLEQDPAFPLALQFYSDELAKFEHYERALELMQRLKEAHPESPTPYSRIPRYYRDLGGTEEALAAYEEFIERFPNDPTVIPDMAGLALQGRDFDKARRYLERIPQIKPDDAVWSRRLELMLANLENWQGRFENAIQHYHKSLKVSEAMNDSLNIFISLATLGTYYDRYEKPDSAVHYFRLAHEFARPVNQLTYPSTTIQLFPDRAEEMRPLLREALNAFKSNTPKDIWHVADVIAELCEAFAQRDTSRMIPLFRELTSLPANQRSAGNVMEFGRLLARTGHYDEALEKLEEALGGTSPTTNGWSYLSITYWIGVCHEGLGETDLAAEKYREVLRFWEHADFDLEAITGARERLARLSG